MKYSRALVDVLNNENLKKLQGLPINKDCCYILLSKLELNTISKDDFFMMKDNLEDKSIILIPTYNNYIVAKNWKKSHELTLIMDWVMKLPVSSSCIMKNNALLYVANKSVEWNEMYDGSMGYAVTAHNGPERIKYHKYGASINNTADNFDFVVFDGFFLKKSNINNDS